MLFEPTLTHRTCSTCSHWWPDSTGAVDEKTGLVTARCSVYNERYPGGHKCHLWKRDPNHAV